MKLPASVAFVVLVVCVASANGATVAGRIVFAANDAPTWSGHIYVSHGRGLTDLSAHTPGLDFIPAVSPDGGRIAFASYRGGHLAVYVMRADGSRVVRVSPFLGVGGPNGNAAVQTITWRPDGKVLAVLLFNAQTARSAVYVTSPSGGWRVIVPAPRAPGIVSGWTADGLLLYVSPQTGGVEGVDSTGRTRFDVPGEAVSASARGSIAVQRDSRTWLLYSAAGHEMTRLPNVAAARWSPDGSLLATVSANGELRIRDTAGTIVSARYPHAQLVGWLGNRIVRLEGPTGIFGASARTARRVTLRLAFRQYTLVSSGTRVASVLYPRAFKAGNVARLVAGSVGGPARNVSVFPICSDEPVLSELQLFGSNGLAYATACTAPAADVFAVSPNGTGLERLTTSPSDDAQPSVSPDGTTIAYVQKDNEMHCSGCPETLWTMNADGTGAHRFPNSTSAELPYDDDPSFSPDGKTILFVRSGPNATGLFTVPAMGGPVHDLTLPGTGALWGPSRIAYDAWPSGKPATVAPDGTGTVLVRGAGSGGTAAWSTDGRLAYLQATQRGALSILLPASGKRITLPRLVGAYLPGLAWSPDGARFAFVATDTSGIADVWTVGSDGTHLTRVTHGLGAVTSLSWR